jgi:4-hydroxy-tetrahydrodipicolinate synthase
MCKNKFDGTGVALITPFDAMGKVDFAALERLVRHVAHGGVEYLVVCGTTAETPTLTTVEKREILAFIKQRNFSALPIMLGIGGNNTADVIKTINATDFDGIDAILSVAPYYNKPSQQGLYEHFKMIGAASPVPVTLYNVPGRTGANLLPDTVLRLAGDVPNIIAIKEASGSVAQVAAIIRGARADFAVLSGDDGLAVPFLSLGARGLISVIANALPTAVATMVRNARNGDFAAAAKIQLDLMDFVEVCFAEGNPAGIKAALATLSISQNYLRLPLVAASAALCEKMRSIISNFSSNGKAPSIQ